MYPHEIISYLYKSGLEIDKKAVKHFWRTSRSNGEQWALFSKASESHVPLGFYGDGAAMILKYGKQESVIGLFMNLPLWRPKTVRCSRFLLFTIEEARLWKFHSLNIVLRHIVWSFNLLYSGLHPAVGMRGEQLPPDMMRLANTPICENLDVFTVTEIRGDWSWMKKILRIRASWQGHSTCHLCSAKSTGPYSDRYYNFESASWDVQPFEYSLAQFLNVEMPTEGICHLDMFSIIFNVELSIQTISKWPGKLRRTDLKWNHPLAQVHWLHWSISALVFSDGALCTWFI